VLHAVVHGVAVVAKQGLSGVVQASIASCGCADDYERRENHDSKIFHLLYTSLFLLSLRF
jgi:hypothetical protein